MEIRTDLALEGAEIYWETAEEKNIRGVECTKGGEGDVRITRVDVLDEEGERVIGKPRGRYVTIEIPSLLESDPATLQKASRYLAEELSKLIKTRGLTLVAGLGNGEITPDSLGPKVVPKLVVTRHLFAHMPESAEGLSPVCALAPGVLGITGIETGEIIKGVAERVRPDLIIVVDALASRKTERVGTTVQIADTGISPGSGVGNKRKAINQETVGVPVIAVGVPMVVDAATIANDTIALVMTSLLQNEEEGLCREMEGLSHEEKHTLIAKSLPKEIRDMMVTPKDIDALSEKVAHIISVGINKALHTEISEEEIEALVG